MRFLAVLLLASALVPHPECDGESAREPSSPSGAPVLTSMTPRQASVGDAITLTGSRFSARYTGVKIGAGSTISFRVDPRLLGGLVVSVGERVLDGSVAGNLESLRRGLK